MEREEDIKMRARKDAFARIAFWQELAFICLLCFVWVIEILDIPRLTWGAEATPFSLYRACALSAGVLAAAVLAIGHTYEQQRSLLRKLLKTCLYCHRVKTVFGKWEHVEEYFIKHYPVSMERGACPACEEMLASMNTADDNINDAIARKGIVATQSNPACATKAS